MMDATRVVLFLDGMPFSPLLIYYAVRAWSTDAYFFSPNSRQNAEVFTPVDAPR